MIFTMHRKRHCSHECAGYYCDMLLNSQYYDYIMKKIKIMHVLIFATMLMLCGCKSNSIESESGLSPASIVKVGTEDSSIDALSMVTNSLVETDNNSEGVGLTVQQLYKTGLCIYSYKNFADNADLNYEEIKLLDLKGDCKSFSSPKGDGGTYSAGIDPSTGGYFKFRIVWPKDEESKCEYFVDKYDRDEALIETINLECLDSFKNIVAYGCMIDQNGLIHVAQNYSEDGKKYYLVISERGELLLKHDLNDYFPIGMGITYDGSVYCKAFKLDEANPDSVAYSMFEYDNATNNIQPLLDYCETKGEKPFDIQFQALNFYEDKYICADSTGIYLYDEKFNNPEILYEWNKHGQTVEQIHEILMDENGRVLITLSSENELKFCVLEPTEEKNELLTVEFAVSPYGKSKYAIAVRDFNRSHPSVVIEMKDDYDKTELLTRIISGDGPVLIDTNLIDLNNMKNNLEPLNTIFEELGLRDSLNDAAISMGTIGDELYGIVTDFAIETMISPYASKGLDYQNFIRSIEDADTSVMPENSKILLATYIFDHGPEDSFFVTEEAERKRINTENLTKLTDCLDRWKFGKSSDGSSDYYLDGEGLIKPMYIKRPEEFVYYKKLYWNRGFNCGYPGKNGAVNYLYTPSMIAVSKSAEKNEKEVAIAFFNMILSYEYQKDMAKSDSFAMSVRSDVLKEQIESVSKESVANVFDVLPFEPEAVIDKEEIERDLDTLIKKSIPYPNDKYREYFEILREEFAEYFENRITKEELVKRIKSRADIYLAEKE